MVAEKNEFPKFYFPDIKNNQYDIHDIHGDFYSAKLSAAVAAREAVAKDKSLIGKKSVKQAIKNWIIENNSLYDLSEEGIDQASIVANWDTSGGAPTSSGK